MATIAPLRGIRYDGAHVQFAGVLAPPYDVISDQDRAVLYGRDLRNIVRIDGGQDCPDDEPGVRDRYTRAAQHLAAWLQLGVLRRDPRPAVYVHEHDFTAALPPHHPRWTRRGVLVRIAARPWGAAEILPHERTLRGPKEERLRLLRATQTHTSPVFGLWDRAPGLGEVLERVVQGPPTMAGDHDGEHDREGDRLWVVDDPRVVAAVVEALAPARLYVADGHHRYETSAAYAAERRAAGTATADSELTLLYLCAADDPAVEVLPTHRLVRPGTPAPVTVRALAERLGEGATVTPAASLQEAAAAIEAEGGSRTSALAGAEGSSHAFAVAGADGAAVARLPRRPAASPRAGLDVTVLHEEVIERACGIDAGQVAEGALGYTRSVDEAAAAVGRGEAVLALCCRPCTTAEVMAVSDAGETMPQKSTYFHPKVPTGLVLSPA